MRELYLLYGDILSFSRVTFNPPLHLTVTNIRIAKSEQRDLLQDLRDVADGLEVVHAVDLKKEQAAKKRESRQRRKEQKERRLNKQCSPAPPKEEQLTLLTEEEHFSDGSQTG